MQQKIQGAYPSYSTCIFNKIMKNKKVCWDAYFYCLGKRIILIELVLQSLDYLMLLT